MMLPIILLAAAPLALAAPNPIQPPNPLVAAGVAAAPFMKALHHDENKHKDEKPTPVLASRNPTRVYRRQFDIGAALDDVFSTLGDIPRYVASGVPNFFQDFPQGSVVLDKLNLKNEDLDAKPTQVLNIPGYANWTDKGWNVLVHGQVYKDPGLSDEQLNGLANPFLIGKDIKDLQPSEQVQARNLTREIFSVPQDDVNVTMKFVPNFKEVEGLSGSLVPAAGGAQEIQLPYATTELGDFAAFVPLQNTTGPNGGYMKPGNLTTDIQALNYYAGNATLGNATAYLVPPKGFTIISDIDDILRITKIYQPDEGLMNSFAKAFVPWMNMPEIYKIWGETVPDLHYHYLTTTPEQATPNYMDFIYKTYPLGSFDTRPLNFSDVSATLSIRKFLLNRIFETYPERKFVLVGDTSNSDVLTQYPQMAKDFPSQVACIFIRNVTQTDGEEFKFPYNTADFKDLNTNLYMFFKEPNDLKGVNFVNGQCTNSSVYQEPTFDYQNVPLQDAAVGQRIGFATAGLAAGLAMLAMMMNAL